MEQLTQPELHQIEELLMAQQLAIKKASAYSRQVQDQLLQQLCQRAQSVHQEHFDTLVKQLHQFSGGLATREGR